MSTFRSKVRAVAVVWLLCQVPSLSAFAPDHCCISHDAEQAAKDKQDACHESEPAPAPEPADPCPMTHDAGAACPMHAGKSSNGCAMSNACEGPGTQLANLFAFIGAIERPIRTAVTLESTALFTAASVPLLYRSTSPDAPPPKA